MNFRFYKSEVKADWYELVQKDVHGFPEGTRQEWSDVAQALKDGKAIRFKRVAVIQLSDSVQFISPRNNGKAISVPKDQVSELVKTIERILRIS